MCFGKEKSSRRHSVRACGYTGKRNDFNIRLRPISCYYLSGVITTDATCFTGMRRLNRKCLCVNVCPPQVDELVFNGLNEHNNNCYLYCNKFESHGRFDSLFKLKF